MTYAAFEARAKHLSQVGLRLKLETDSNGRLGNGKQCLANAS
jgi:hypothetical protein